MIQANRILLQTTIPTAIDDWSISRFSLLTGLLRSIQDLSGQPIFEVTARDRDPVGAPDMLLSTLDKSDFDQLWLFAVDTGDGLTPEDCGGISRFRTGGGALMVTRDHMILALRSATWEALERLTISTPVTLILTGSARWMIHTPPRSFGRTFIQARMGTFSQSRFSRPRILF